MIKSKRKISVGITMGDPSGVGPFIAAQAVASLKGKAEFVLIGDALVFEKSCGVKVKCGRYQFIDLKNVNRSNFKFGRVKGDYGRAAIQYLDKALELVRRNKVDCIVTCPISKESINLAGYSYSGHTEYFIKKTGSKDVVMMLLNDKLKISLVTRHIPFKEVPLSLNKEKIEKVAVLTSAALRELFGLKSPSLVMCGLNPHASDNGLIGNEENNILKPAVAELKRKGVNIAGPMPSDVAISKAARGKYDALIAMYHDQALIPLKLLGDESGVNLTLGLPFVRTSPLHGTAFDIAGTAKADPSSLIAAIKLALKCVSNLKKD